MLGVKIRELREAQGLSQVELAKRAGVSRVYVTRLESGGLAHPSMRYLLRLSKALHVEPSVLFSAAGYAVPAPITREMEHPLVQKTLTAVRELSPEAIHYVALFTDALLAAARKQQRDEKTA